MIKVFEYDVAPVWEHAIKFILAELTRENIESGSVVVNDLLSPTFEYSLYKSGEKYGIDAECNPGEEYPIKFTFMARDFLLDPRVPGKIKCHVPKGMKPLSPGYAHVAVIDILKALHKDQL